MTDSEGREVRLPCSIDAGGNIAGMDLAARFFTIAAPAGIGLLDSFQHDRRRHRKESVMARLGDERGGAG